MGSISLLNVRKQKVQFLLLFGKHIQLLQILLAELFCSVLKNIAKKKTLQKDLRW